LAALVTNPNSAIFLLLGLLLVLAILSNPSFAEPGQFMRFLGRAAPVVIAAVGQYFVIVAGELDLSMGALITAQVIIAGNLIGQDEARVVPVMLGMVAFGLFIGLVNGLITTMLKVPSLIGTLGMLLILSGLIFWWTGGSAGENPVDSFRQLGRGGIELPILDFIPYSVIILLGVIVAGVVFVRRPLGKGMVSIGGNPTAARLSGIRVVRGKIVAFLLSSLAATITGVLLVGFAGVNPSVGQGFEFVAVTAVVLGGVALGGGRGWLMGAVAGALTLELLFVVLNFYGVPATYRDTVQGLIIIGAVAAAQANWGNSPLKWRRSTKPPQTAEVPSPVQLPN
jgi:ribose transport system permease protein